MKKKLSLLMSFLILGVIGICAFSQSTVIKGKILDDEGTEVIGANILIKGIPGKGTITDVNGNFILQVNDIERDVLVISYIGMETLEVEVKGKTNFNIVLKSNTFQLSELVKIGYTTVRRKDLTGAVSSVNTKDIEAIPISDLTNTLSGKVAGVQIIRSQGSPDADVSVKIRGGTSITQSNEPLYIIDGFPSEDGLKGIAATDIESIDILKDASSTAIYGARGANGVVLITTKGGRKDKLNISYDMFIGYKKVNKKYDVLNVLDFVKLDYERSLEEPDRMRDVILPTYGEFNEFNSLYGTRKGIDWQKEVFERRLATNQQHKFTVSGGGQTSQYIFSYTRTNDDGIWYGSNLKRDNFRLKVNNEASKWLNLSANVNYIDESTEGLGSLQDGGAFSRMQHVIQYRPTIGKNREDIDLIKNDDDPVLLLSGASPMQSPIASIESETIKKRNRILTINGDVEVKIIKNLSYRGTVGVRKRMKNDDIFYSERSKQAKNAGAPYGWKNIYDDESFMYNNVISFNKNFNSQNQLDVLIGQEYIVYASKFLKTGATNFPKKNFELNDMSLGATPDKVITMNQEEKMLSYFIRTNYNLEDKYMFAASLRADGSSKFGANNKWGYFPSMSVAWRASEENFIKNLDVFSNLKLRLSYGAAGNNQIDNYLSLSKIGSVWIPYGVGSQSGFVSKQLQNPNLKWETNISTNLGLDIGFWDQKLEITFDVYNIDTKDLLLNANIPLLSGYPSSMINAGRTNNKGVEFSITSRNIDTNNFSWSTNFNLSHNKNTVKELYATEYMEIVSNWTQSSEFNKSDYLIKVGQPLGQMYGYRLEGIYTVDDFTYDATAQKYIIKPNIPYDKTNYPKPGYWKFANLSSDNEITSEDREVIGNANPKIYGGITNVFTFRGFDLSVFFNFSIGNKVYSANKMYYTKLNNQYRNTITNGLNRYTIMNESGENIFHNPEQLRNANKYNNFVSIEGSSNLYFHSGYVEDGSFLKVNNISLGYTLPKEIIQKTKISNIRFYVTGNSLYTFTKYTGYDPEVNTFPNKGLTPGIDWGAYPSALSLIFGANISF